MGTLPVQRTADHSSQDGQTCFLDKLLEELDEEGPVSKNKPIDDIPDGQAPSKQESDVAEIKKELEAKTFSKPKKAPLKPFRKILWRDA